MPAATGSFTVDLFAPAEVSPPDRPAIETAVPVGVAHLRKTFTGAIDGQAQTLFTSAFSHETGVGTYLAMESFEGTIDGRRGTLNIAHTATTTGADRQHALLVIVPGSGTGDLAGLTGTGDLVAGPDGHSLTLHYEG